MCSSELQYEKLKITGDAKGRTVAGAARFANNRYCMLTGNTLRVGLTLLSIVRTQRLRKERLAKFEAAFVSMPTKESQTSGWLDKRGAQKQAVNRKRVVAFQPAEKEHKGKPRQKSQQRKASASGTWAL
jgi:hypothetical protein